MNKDSLYDMGGMQAIEFCDMLKPLKTFMLIDALPITINVEHTDRKGEVVTYKYTRSMTFDNFGFTITYSDNTRGSITDCTPYEHTDIPANPIMYCYDGGKRKVAMQAVQWLYDNGKLPRDSFKEIIRLYMFDKPSA